MKEVLESLLTGNTGVVFGICITLYFLYAVVKKAFEIYKWLTKRREEDRIAQLEENMNRIAITQVSTNEQLAKLMNEITSTHKENKELLEAANETNRLLNEEIALLKEEITLLKEEVKISKQAAKLRTQSFQETMDAVADHVQGIQPTIDSIKIDMTNHVKQEMAGHKDYVFKALDEVKIKLDQMEGLHASFQALKEQNCPSYKKPSE